MKVLVACEFSGTVRDAFIARGHEAMSCDLLDTDVPGPHHKGSVLDILSQEWDLMIAHPPCTHLAVSGARWFKDKVTEQAEALEFVKLLMATCLWLKNLKPLSPTNIVSGREPKVHRLPPSEDRWKLRSKTYQGIADAMAAQWG
jgi:hypothetical protein